MHGDARQEWGGRAHSNGLGPERTRAWRAATPAGGRGPLRFPRKRRLPEVFNTRIFNGFLTFGSGRAKADTLYEPAVFLFQYKVGSA